MVAEHKTRVRDTLIKIHAPKKAILVDIFDKGGAALVLKSGQQIWLPSDEGIHGVQKDHGNTHPGIRPRWARVLAVSEEAAEMGISLGDMVFCDTLKWSRRLPYASFPGKEPLYFWRMLLPDVLLIDSEGRDAYVDSLRARLNEAQWIWYGK